MPPTPGQGFGSRLSGASATVRLGSSPFGRTNARRSGLGSTHRTGNRCRSDAPVRLDDDVIGATEGPYSGSAEVEGEEAKLLMPRPDWASRLGNEWLCASPATRPQKPNLASDFRRYLL
jgi:hypothetical protein